MEPLIQKDLQQSSNYKAQSDSFTSNFPLDAAIKFLGPNYINALEQLSAGTVYAGNNKLPVLVCDHTRSQKYHVQRSEPQGASA